MRKTPHSMLHNLYRKNDRLSINNHILLLVYNRWRDLDIRATIEMVFPKKR